MNKSFKKAGGEALRWLRAVPSTHVGRFKTPAGGDHSLPFSVPALKASIPTQSYTLIRIIKNKNTIFVLSMVAVALMPVGILEAEAGRSVSSRPSWLKTKQEKSLKETTT